MSPLHAEAVPESGDLTALSHEHEECQVRQYC
jgi:hypothetical protein